MTRTTEQLAPPAIAELIPKLTMLTTEQPTTAELEEALLASKAITRAIFEWLASRYSAKAAATILADDVCSPELDAALNEWEESQDRAEDMRPAAFNMTSFASSVCGMKQRPA